MRRINVLLPFFLCVLSSCRTEKSQGGELLQGAENGRYKVVAKAEPYKNLPPAPVTPDDFLNLPTEKPLQPQVTYHSDNFRSQGGEGVRFASVGDRTGTNQFVPVRETPVYRETTPSSFHTTPPAIEFVQTKSKKKEAGSTPQPGKFKISVENVDFRPTPPPPKSYRPKTTTTTTTTTRRTTTRRPTQNIKQKEESHRKKPVPHRQPVAASPPIPHRQQAAAPPPIPHRQQAASPPIPQRHQSASPPIPHRQQGAAPPVPHRQPAVSPTSPNRPKQSQPKRPVADISNEIVTDTSQAVSTSIYDPRPRTRTHTKDFNRPKKTHKAKKTRLRSKLKKYKKNYNLPIRGTKKYSRSKGKEAAAGPRKQAEKEGRSFESTVPGFTEVDKDAATSKRSDSLRGRHNVVGAKPVKALATKLPTPQPIFINTKTVNVPVRPPTTPAAPLIRPVPTRPPPSPFHAPVPSTGPTPFPALRPEPIFLSGKDAFLSPNLRPGGRALPPPAPKHRQPTPPTLEAIPHSPTPSPVLQTSTPLSLIHQSPTPPPFRPLPQSPVALSQEPLPPPPNPRPLPPIPHQPAATPLHPTPLPLQPLPRFPSYAPVPPVGAPHISDELSSLPDPFEDYDAESYKPRPYSFNYGVKDEYSGVEYNRAESRSDHGVTRGEYKVALPDGRTQLVSYIADDNGFHATVSYEGEPSYPSQEEYRDAKSFRESNKVENTPAIFIKPTPKVYNAQPTEKSYSLPAKPKAKYSPPPPLVKAKYSPPPPPVVKAKYSPPPPPVVKASPSPLLYSPTPAPYTPTPVAYSPTPAPYSPTPAPYTPTPPPYSPSPSPYTPTPTQYTPTPSRYPPTKPPLAYSPTPSPYTPTPTPYSPTTTVSPFYGSPTPLPYGPYDVSPTPAPLLDASPRLIGLKSVTPTINSIPSYSYEPVNPNVKSLSVPASASARYTKYIPPTTWKPKYPKILEHTLRTQALYTRRLKKHARDEHEFGAAEQEEDEYNYEYYE